MSRFTIQFGHQHNSDPRLNFTVIAEDAQDAARRLVGMAYPAVLGEDDSEPLEVRACDVGITADALAIIDEPWTFTGITDDDEFAIVTRQVRT